MTHPFPIEEVERAIRMRGRHPGRTVLFERVVLRVNLLRYTTERRPLEIDNRASLTY